MNAQFWALPILEKPPPPRTLGRGWPGLGHILVTIAPVAHQPTACSEGKAVWQVLGRVPTASPPPGDIPVSPRHSLTPCWSPVEVSSQFRVAEPWGQDERGRHQASSSLSSAKALGFLGGLLPSPLSWEAPKAWLRARRKRAGSPASQPCPMARPRGLSLEVGVLGEEHPSPARAQQAPFILCCILRGDGGPSPAGGQVSVQGMAACRKIVFLLPLMFDLKGGFQPG